MNRFLRHITEKDNTISQWLFTTGGVAETEVRTFLDICPKRSGTLLQLGPGYRPGNFIVPIYMSLMILHGLLLYYSFNCSFKQIPHSPSHQRGLE